jgi:hypothetical protein
MKLFGVSIIFKLSLVGMQLPEKIQGEFRRFERRPFVWSWETPVTPCRRRALKRRNSPYIFQVYSCIPTNESFGSCYWHSYTLAQTVVGLYFAFYINTQWL